MKRKLDAVEANTESCPLSFSEMILHQAKFTAKKSQNINSQQQYKKCSPMDTEVYTRADVLFLQYA